MTKKLKLILPNKKYLNSFTRGLEEFRKEKTPQADSLFGIFKSAKDFPSFVKKIRAARKGINLGKNKVPNTLYWAMVGSKFVGIVKFRHKLNKKLLKLGGHIGYAVVPSARRQGYATEMLRQGLKKAKAIGIKTVRIGCDEKNIASKKVIEANGGLLKSREKMEGVYKLKFWINV